MISKLRIDKMSVEFVTSSPRFSFIADKGETFTFNLYKEGQLVYQKEVSLDDSIGFKADYKFEEGERYVFNISSLEERSEDYSFTIFDSLDKRFISVNNISHPTFFKTFNCKNVIRAKLVITGLGLYVAKINSKKVGKNYLTPGLNDYDEYLRYQEYDVTDLIKEENIIEVTLGDGLYKGRMGFDNHPGNIYGDKYLLCASLILEKEDGREVIYTDSTWKARESEYVFSTIYDGEVIDKTKDVSHVYEVDEIEAHYNLIPQFGPSITAHEEIVPELIISPKGEKILDYKQNMVGFVRFINRTERGTIVHLQHGEVLQNGCFYRDNLRSAKEELIYTSSGEKDVVETAFSFYGFRYVKVEGIDKIDVNDFVGVVLHSDLEETMKCETSDPLLNKLIHNALWGQKGNFLDVPTDCPQRDERLGWTGDAQVFAATASMNMLTEKFYEKFLKDLRGDQIRYYDGNIPSYSPSLKRSATVGGAVWSDAATIIPLKVYEAYGNKDFLEANYPLMKDYVEVLIKDDEKHNFNHLVTYGFTFGDWLAMDGATSQSRKGGTEDSYIQTIYYFNSLNILAKAASILGKEDDYSRYSSLALEVKKAILNEYFTPNGRLAIDTQAGYVLSLYYKIYIDKEKVINGFKTRLQKDMFTMKSGFVGTPLIIQTLLDNDMEEDAYRMLFSKKCPGWFFSILLGATTIWERWNSILEDGSISGTSMNSLNHYAYGSVCEAIYTRIAGLMNKGNAYKEVVIKPHISYQLNKMNMTYSSIRGDYSIKYKINKDNSFDLDVVIPHGCKATVVLPYKKEDNTFEVGEGQHHFNYILEKDLIHPFNMFTSMIDILNNEKALKACEKHPLFVHIARGDEEMSVNSPFVLAIMGFLPVNMDQAKELDLELRKVEI